MFRRWSTSSPVPARTSTRRVGAAVVAVALLLSLAACGGLPAAQRLRLADIPPLLTDDGPLRAEESAGGGAVNLLAVNDDMRAFVEEYTGGMHNQRTRLLALHTAVKSPAALNVRYDPFADGSAGDVFRSGSANCLSYANLFVALAREAGLDARYQWMDIRPEWQRLGERVAVRLHVNVLVRTRGGDEYMIDIDPLQRYQIAGSRVLSDSEAAALFHSNRAMAALSEERLADAWRDTLRALQLAPGMSHLWVNLGAIYRSAGQNDAAEKAYFRALALDRADHSAMNNLMVLYDATGREEESAYWEERMHRYRLRNPYYHASLGDAAGERGDWDAAYEHYSRAVKLHAEDGQLLYALGLIEYKRGNFDAATQLIEQAIDAANFAVDERAYRIQLEAIREQSAAAL